MIDDELRRVSKFAQTPLADLVNNAVERMEAGARMILDSIPGDSSLSSSSHSQDVTIEIAKRFRRAQAAEEKMKMLREAFEPTEEAIECFARREFENITGRRWDWAGATVRRAWMDVYEEKLKALLAIVRDIPRARAALEGGDDA